MCLLRARLCIQVMMKIIVRFVFVFLVLFSMGQNSFAQKTLRSVRSALKNKKYADALKLVEKHTNDSTLTDKAQLFFYGFEASKKLNDAENEKIYLQQRQDTVAFFNSLYNIFKYALLTDSVASRVTGKNSVNRYRKAYLSELNAAYPNLTAATRYFITKKKWNEVSQFSQIGIEAQKSSIFNEQAANVSAHQLAQFAEGYLYANFAQKRFLEATRYDSLALTDTANLEGIYEILVQISEQTQNDSLFVEQLKKGVELYPRNMFFFTQLSDYYLNQKQSAEVLKVVSTLQPNDTLNTTLYEYQAKAFFQLNQYAKCIASAERLHELDSTSVISDYYMGQSYFHLAREIDMPQSIKAPGYKEAYKKQSCLYKKARPYMELYKKNAPNDHETWVPILYEIYLKLNLGKEFEEISKHIQK